ncbi:MAG: hypothetical protein ACJ716_14925 [Marmoricola sp.]
MEYDIEPAVLDVDGHEEEFARFVLLGETTTSVEDLLVIAPGTASRAQRTRSVDAWLTELFHQNEDILAVPDVKIAAEQAGYSLDQVKRAKERLNVVSTKAPRWWMWTLMPD